MKFRKSGRVLLAAAAAIGAGLGLVSCSPSNTVDYVFVTSSKANPGQINVYRTDSLSGALTKIPDSPFPSGGRNPVAAVTSPDGKVLYVANNLDNNIVQFAIGTDGKLYPNTTCNTPGSNPVSLGLSPDGSLLYVVDTYSPVTPGGAVYSSANPGPGALMVFPVSVDTNAQTDKLNCTPINQTFVDSTNTTQTANYIQIGWNPTGVAALASGQDVYVTGQNGASGGTNTQGFVWAFANNGGTLNQINGSPYSSGVAPSAIAADPTNRFLYATDSRQNQLIVWTINSDGTLNPNQNGPYKTDTFPIALTIDPRGQFIYVANYVSGDITAFTINQSTGTPSATAGTGTGYQTGAGPSCVLVEPALGRFVYTANFIDNTVTGLQLDPNKGTLTANQDSPYEAAGQPTCVAAIPHGNHSTQHVQPSGGS